MKREIPTGFTKHDILKIVETWNAINILVRANIMPDIDMAVEDNGPYIDRWFNVLNDGRTADMCITNLKGEKPHLDDVIDLWDGSNDTDLKTFTIQDLREIVGV